MKYRSMTTLMILAAAVRLTAADGDRTLVVLHVNPNVTAWSSQVVDFGGTKDAKVIAEPGTTRQGKAAGLTILATRSTEDGGVYVLQLKSADGEAVSTKLTAATPARVEIRRRAGVLPYRIALDPTAGPNGSPWEVMMLTPEYRAEGTLAVGDCRAMMSVWDMNADGVFDRRDFLGGTAVGVDLNGDGKISGKGEFLFGGEVFEFCGRRFFVDPDSLKPDGSAVTIVETSLEKPQLGKPVPTFLLQTMDGSTLRSSDWKGKVVLLDFWASWCGYCIAGFPKIKEMQEAFAPTLQVIAINTDEPSAIPAARKVMASHEMPWPEVMSGKGLNDPAWMMFRALESGLPQYVVIDREGVIRYSGSGGKELVELKAAVDRFTRP